MKLLAIISGLVMLTHAQRPSYASSGPIGRPGLASRFKDDNESSSSTVFVENRVGVDGSTAKIPVDARGDYDLVNTLNTWEREHQPFWLLNADHIEKARNTTRGGQQITNRGQFNPQNGQGSQTNFQEAQASQGNQRNQGSSSVQGSLSSSSSNNVSNSGNDRYPSANRDWIYGSARRPSQGDIKPIYEAPEPSPTDKRMNQNASSQNRPRFHYERNNFH